MSETAPTSEAPLSLAAQAEITRIKEETAIKKAEAEQREARGLAQVMGNEAFGMNDITVPNRGEVSHHDYHAQRPSDGIVRDGDSLRRNGQYASQADYDQQTGDTIDKRVDALSHINDGIEVSESPDYESMRLHELALEAAKAENLGDKAEVDTIHGVVEHLLMEAATAPGSTVTDKEYQDELTRFATLVELARTKILNKTEAGQTDTTINKTETDSETPSESLDADDVTATEKNDVPPADADEEKSEAPDTTTESDTSASSETETATEETSVDGPKFPGQELELYKGEKTAEVVEHKAGDDAEYDGYKVSINQTSELPDGTKVYEVTKPDGSRTLVYEGDLTFPTPETDKESLGNRLKTFWKKGSEIIKNRYTMAYLGERWTALMNNTINKDVDPTLPFDMQEKQRLRNRTKYLLGTAAVLIIGTIIARNLGHMMSGNGVAEAANSGTLPDVGVGKYGEGVTDSPDQSVVDALNPSSGNETGAPVVADRYDEQLAAAAADQQLPTPEALPVVDPSFNVSEGEGGYELFNNLGISETVWDQNAQTLLQNFPNDFMTLPNGSVGIAHQGLLSDQAQSFINALKP